MSAFVVSYNHINSIVNWCVKQSDLLYGISPEQLGQLFWDENVKSVNYRYKEEETAHKYNWTPSSETLTAIQIIKLVQCLVYQSCEHDEWKSSEAYNWSQKIISWAASKLPGWEEAEWTIN